MTGTATEPKVACLVLTWNDTENTLECLASLTELDYPNKTLVVIDNGSTDGSLARIKARFPDLTYIENDKNLMWSGGNNTGLEWVLQRDFDYALLLNNDITVAPDMLKELVRYAESAERPGLLGPKIYYHSAPDLIWYAGAEMSLWRGYIGHRGLRERDRGQYDRAGETAYVTGCALMIRREVLETVGLIDTDFTFYGEDSDYCIRAREAGFKVCYVPAATMWHKVSASVGTLSFTKIRFRLKSNFKLFRRHAPVWALFTTIPLGMVWEVARTGWSQFFRRGSGT